MPSTRTRRSVSTTKSAPLRLKASTGAGAPLARRAFSTARTDLLVMSGFCSEPESANSFSTIFCEAVALRLADECDERLDQARARSPGDVEPGYGVAGALREATASLGPADVRQEADAPRVQPRSLLSAGPVDVGLRPAARPLVLGPVEPGRAQPVLPGELARVPDPHPALLRAVHEEQAAERPERLAAERLLRLLVDEDHVPPGRGQFRGGDEACEAGPDDDGVGLAPRRLLVRSRHR